MEQALPGKIDKYDVVGLIARGGMGVVYKAIDRSLDRFVAIKMVGSADGEHGDHLKRFFREAQFTANLRHQNIVIVYGMGDVAGTPYLVMEYLSGSSLDEIIRTASLSLQQKVACMWQACNGLQYAHTRQPSIIHRDIKPANIVVAEDGTVKIIDFGIARLGQSRNTRTGFVIGSLPYMSPEQINGQELDGRTDIFSAGVVLYQLLTGALPFSGKTIAETLQKVVSASPPPLNQFLKEYPKGLDDVIARALAKNREERYRSAGEFAFDLLQLEEQLKRNLFATNLERAEALMGQGEYEGAKQELARILGVDRANVGATDLLRRVKRAEAKKREKTRALNLRVQAEEALRLNRLQEALSYLDQALRLDPSDAALRVFRERIVARQDHAEKVNDLLARAEQAITAGDLNAAAHAIEEAFRFDPDSARVKAFRAILETRQASARVQEGRSAGASSGREDRAWQRSIKVPEGNIVGDAPTWPSERIDASATDPVWSDTGFATSSSYGSDLYDRSTSEPQPGCESTGKIPPFSEDPEDPKDASSEEATAALPAIDQGATWSPVVPAVDGQIRTQTVPVPSESAVVAASKEAAADLTTFPPASVLPEDRLRVAEKQLAAFVGPMSKLMVKKAASMSTTLDEFYALLAESIEQPKERGNFLTAVRSSATQAEAVQGMGESSADSSDTSQDPRCVNGLLTPAAVEQASRSLAKYVGPLAGVLARKAASRTHSLRALYVLLAEHIGNELERRQFLSDAGFA
jgi:tetratricopeptide (TPR) repeat protein/predicted Ser/Thr protein kinase